MTALAPDLAPAPRPLVQRLANVVRLHLANPFTIVLTPLLILGLIWLLNLAIWWIVRTSVSGDAEAVGDVSEGFQYSGASFWIFVYMMVVAIQAMNMSFSFALGFSSTRRDYYLGTVVTFVGLSAFYALLYIGAAALETWTGGWWLGGAMFNSFAFGADSAWWLRLFHIFVGFLFFFFIGAAVGAMYVRWKQRGIIGFFLILGVLVIGGAALLTLTESWAAFGGFFATVGFTGAYALSLIPTAIAAVAGYLILRRATPRN